MNDAMCWGSGPRGCITSVQGTGRERSEDLAALDNHLDALLEENDTVTLGIADVVLAASHGSVPELDALGTLDHELASVALGLEDLLAGDGGGRGEVGGPLGDLGRAVDPVGLLLWAAYVSF